MDVWRLIRSVLFRFDPERMHALAQAMLRLVGRPAVVRRLKPAPRPELRTVCLGLEFENPLGLAAGFDKGEVNVAGLFGLGFGHVEIGTITPRPQPGNPRPRLFRLVEHEAIVNRMGFNNDGAQACAERLARLDPALRAGILGVNVGRNKVTPNEEADRDYVACIEQLQPHADYLVVNISSPNTPGLRQLQERAALERLLGACADVVRRSPHPKPLLVKLAPDLDPEAIDEAVDVAIAAGVSGIVATNTTISRPAFLASHPRAGEAGGLSGAPLAPISNAVIARVHRRAAGRVPVVGVGGVLRAEDAYARIRAGASLVQAYTGFIYEGPLFARRILKGLAELLRRDGFSRVEDAVGADHRTPTVGRSAGGLL